MRIITGKSRGTYLVTIKGIVTRPTPSKVKESIFSSLQFQIKGRTVLDLFAGTGQLGVEAVSRGAKRVIFNDIDERALYAVNRNLERVGLLPPERRIHKYGYPDGCEVYRLHYNSFFIANKEMFDIVFLDPPYEEGIIEKVLPLLKNRMNPNGRIVCEHESSLTLPDKIVGMKKFEKERVRVHGRTTVTVYHLPEKK